MMRTVCGGTVGSGLSFEEHLCYVKSLGFDEVDLILISDWVYFSTGELSAHYGALRRRITAALEKSGMRAASMNFKLSVPLEAEDMRAQRDMELDAVIRLMRDLEIDRASMISAQTLDEAYLAKILPAEVGEIVRLQRRARDAGIRLCLEPHILTSFCHSETVRRALGVYPELLFTYDPSHFLHSGETTAESGFIAEHTAVAHLRDARPGEMFVPYGDGTLDLTCCVNRLIETGYDGPVSMEFIIDRPDDALERNLMAFTNEVNRLILAPKHA